MSATQNPTRARPGAGELRRGDRVRVRSTAEILATLDENGDTGQLPFMPEMLPLCGRTFEVQARADKTCDTINLEGCSRTMSGTVHLVGARCDGSAHGGCQAGCLLFFKESWLERADPSMPVADSSVDDSALEPRLTERTETEPGVFRCQATQLLEASQPLNAKDYRHWLRDIQTRNAQPMAVAKALALAIFNKYQRLSRRLPRPMRIADGATLPRVRGGLTKTPHETLGLQPGELVEVKSREEIMATLDTDQRNRGLWFDAEMLPYCGRRARVLRRVNRIIDEKTGRMVEMKNPCIVLDSFVCGGGFNKLCPRAIYAYWREIWLRRVDEPNQETDTNVGSR